MHPRLAVVSAVLAIEVSASIECRIPLERPYSLGHPTSHPLEAAHGGIVRGRLPLAFAFPEYDGNPCDEYPRPRIAWADSAGGNAVGLLAMLGEEYRSLGGGPWATEAGGLLAGRRGPVQFNLDARITAEIGGRRGRPSFDREDVDDQDEETSGSLDYRSFSRFRGDLSLDLSFGRFTVARDAAHWGPGLFLNPMFHQEAVPFFQYAFSTEIGPLRVTSLYGDLAIGESQAYASENLDSRSLYAHRYELGLGKSWHAGLSEQIILYDLSKPYLFIPIFPLFVAKGLIPEERTNGSISADLAWRTPWSTLVYAEFLLDDLESPSSLLTQDYIQNKWAFLAGAHWSRAFGSSVAGMIAEFGQVEPWVYAHFRENTAQAAHAGFPLGNPFGADSRTMVIKAYGRFPAALYAGLKMSLLWKGEGESSDIGNPVPETPTAQKRRLEGEGRPEFLLDPEIQWTFRHLHLYFEGRIAREPAIRAGFRAFY